MTEPQVAGHLGQRRQEGQTFAGESLFLRYVNFVKLPHTVFALPFAFLGVVYASFAAAVTPSQVMLVLVAFTAARFAAMGFNRIVDRRYDALNPRTRFRELPTRRLSLAQATVAVVVACGTFVGAAALLNPLCLALSPVALAWILIYSYTKRITAWTHVWLGAGLGIAPAAGYLAVTGAWSDPWWTLPAIALAVLTWVAGFDIFYALPDEQFDRDHRLRSAAVLLGQRRSILVAKVLHGVTVLMLVVFALGAPFGVVYYAGVAAAAVILGWEHHLVRPADLSRLDAAFFRMNGIMSVVVFAFALGDRLL
ncbi:MAG: 4-hydroxybenzoate octaprenyltransferase [Gemmatimonadales bacterium]|nr:4-hydroxybenzoate octaprenyltransferase [Gemmatimonadales bacterium]NIN12642.1 4-hydroxybenzoate octaprenyltransferase [Gemmatimonadales bacterium]NIR02435.1 4-hydroxybenzoate octaprenyltransferase [Gemmatimonadales bacterium]NIS66226.1 4-hydroxybenzoate octaprenyltransferase [Gemmatimonadales bacterium]